MKYLPGLEGLSMAGKHLKPPIHITIGVFDGVHLGHQKILTCLTHRRSYAGGSSVVITFVNHPLEVVRGVKVRCISPLWFRLNAFEGFGVEWVIGLEFTRELARMTPDEFVRFIKSVFKRWKGASGLMVCEGENFRFGYGNVGDVEWLMRKRGVYGYQVRAVDRVKVGGRVVSSSLVRELISRGEFELVEKMLGRRFFMEGEVLNERGVGREIGFPTANLRVNFDCVLPPAGVYAGWGVVGDEVYPAMIYAGTRPTFDGSQYVVETHLIGYNAGKIDKLRIEFVSFVRREKRFSDLSSLRTALVSDKKKILKILEGGYAT